MSTEVTAVCQLRDSGSEHSSTGSPQKSSLLDSIGYAASKKHVRRLSDYTIKSLQASSRRCASLLSQESLEPDIGSPPKAPRPTPTSGRMTPPSPEQDLNLVRSRLEEMLPLTGSSFAPLLNPGTLQPSLRTYTFVIIGPYLQLLRTMRGQLGTSVPFLFSGAELGLEKVSLPGKRQVFRLMAKIPVLNGIAFLISRWCGYRGEAHVIVDEFRGGIDISHILRWTDRYPVCVETKGSSRPLVATSIWITSNLDPRNWYPDLDPDSLDALLRRLNITHFE